MTRSLGMIMGAIALGAVAGYGVSVAMGAPEGLDAGLRAGTDRGKEQLVLLLQRKEESLNRRQQTITAREADVRAAEEQVERRIIELQELREQVRASLASLDGDRQERVNGLVKMFESMRPNQAADILTVTDNDIALEVLERMNRGKAGKTLAAMDPKRAAYLAERIGKAALVAQ